MKSGHPVHNTSLFLGGLRRHSRKADRPSLFAAFFRSQGLCPIKGEVPPLDVEVCARLLERKSVRVFWPIRGQSSSQFFEIALAT